MAAADGLIFTTWNPAQTGVSLSTFTLNETADYYAVVFRAPHTDTIAKAFVNIASVSGSPTVEISIQGVSSGVPDGTIKSSGSAKKQFAASAGASWQTLDATYSPTQGELLAVVVKLISGTSATINVRISGGTSLFPAGFTYDNATATKTPVGSPPIWGIKGAGTDWCHGNPISSSATTNVTTASVIETGAVFVSPSWSTLRLIGVRVLFRLNASSTAEIRVYSGNGAADTTVAQSISVDVSELYSSASVLFASFFFPAVTISPSSGFRISVRTTAGTYVETANTFVDAEDAKAYGPFNGFAYRTRRTTGNWTDATNVGVSLEPIFDDVSVSSGTTLIAPSKKVVVPSRYFVARRNRQTVITQTVNTTTILPLAKSVLRQGRTVVHRKSASVVTVPVVTQSYIPLLQARRISVRECRVRRASPVVTISTVTPGSTVYVPVTQPKRVQVHQRSAKRQVPVFLSSVATGPTVYIPVAQTRKLHVQQKAGRRQSPVFLQSVTTGPTVYVPLRQIVARHVRQAPVIKRALVHSIAIQQAAQTVLISSPRVMR